MLKLFVITCLITEMNELAQKKKNFLAKIPEENIY